VVVGGAISVYEKTGQYQLIARFMRPDGAGDLAAQLELLRARLEAEGLFDPSRKRCLPFIPRAIAVCTSPTGAAVRDICSIIARRWPLARVQVIPTAVQGAEAVPGLLRALELANGLDDVDVIIVGRGGGSIEDLWAFNEEPVVRAIFASRTPVISAVGHETDFTLSDFAADVRAATPSMAAELAVPDHNEVAALLVSQGRHLRSALTARLQQQHRLLDRLAAHPLLSRPEALLEQRGQRLDDAAAALSGNLARRVERLRARTERVVASLEALSPLAVIGRGYSILQRADGAVVRRLADANLGDDLTARVADGHISAQVTALKPTGEPA
jgi:exodeoxyribonuclease VII large subunit